MRKLYINRLLPLLLGMAIPYFSLACTLASSDDTQAEVIVCFNGPPAGTTITIPDGVTINMNGDWNLTSLGAITIIIQGTGSLVFSGNGTNADELILATGSSIIIENTNNNNAIIGTGAQGQERITIGGEDFPESLFLTIIGSGGLTEAGPGVLPVELTSFQGKRSQQGIQLSWITASELNNDYFELEYSRNGRDFQAITKINGAGTTSLEQYYEYLHRNYSAGTNYYRLRQVDFDGQYSISDVITVDLKEGSDSPVEVFPNPANEELNIQFANEESEVVVQWFDARGSLIFTERFVDSINIQSAAPGLLSSGLYLLNIQRPGKTPISQKILLK